MRLWASSDTITFDELAPKLGEVVEISLGLSIQSVHRFGRMARDFAYHLAPFGPKVLVQIPALHRAVTCATGTLTVHAKEPPSWILESAVTLEVLGTREAVVRSSLERVLGGGASADCEALGTLSVAGRELGGPRRTFVPARVLRFQSLGLRAGDENFGTWSDVARYRDLGSDPDVIAAPVLLAEIELLL